MYYLIRESLTPCEPEDIASGGAQYVAVLTPEEWQQRGESFEIPFLLPRKQFFPEQKIKKA